MRYCRVGRGNIVLRHSVPHFPEALCVESWSSTPAFALVRVKLINAYKKTCLEHAHLRTDLYPSNFSNQNKPL